MHNISFEVSDSDYEILNKMAEGSHKSKAEIMLEALRSKAAFDMNERDAVRVGLQSAETEQLLSHEDMQAEMDAFEKRYQGRVG